MFSLVGLGCAHTMQNEKEPLPIVLYFGKPQRRAIISHEAAQIRRAEGSAKFDKHEKIHRNKQQYYLVTQGRCAQCGIEGEACEPIRVSILRSLAAPRYSASLSGKHMRVKPSRSGRKIDHNRRLIRDIAPTHAQIVGEMREINQPPGLKAWCPERDHLTDDLRSLDLEVLDAKIYGGIEAAKAKRAEQKRLFIGCLSRLEKEPGLAHHVAEQIVNYSKFFFPSHASVLDPFEPFLKELSNIAQCRQLDRSELLRWHRTKRRILGVLRRITY
jgi:hypothetical protein